MKNKESLNKFCYQRLIDSGLINDDNFDILLKICQKYGALICLTSNTIYMKSNLADNNDLMKYSNFHNELQSFLEKENTKNQKEH